MVHGMCIQWCSRVAWLAVGAGCLLGCGHKAQEAPALSQPAVAASPEPPKKNFLDRAGDATWEVVTAPVRLVSPGKKPVEKKEPEVYEPADTIIVTPWRDEPAPAAATQPK